MPRNAHRAYNADGTMITPPAVGECRAEGEVTAEATYWACGYDLAIEREKPWPADRREASQWRTGGGAVRL